MEKKNILQQFFDICLMNWDDGERLMKEYSVDVMQDLFMNNIWPPEEGNEVLFAMYYKIINNYQKMIEFYDKAIDKGNVIGHIGLGNHYWLEATRQDDYDKKIELIDKMVAIFEPAITKNDSDAMLNLGKNMIDFEDINKYSGTAEKYLLEAVRENNFSAFYLLSFLNEKNKNTVNALKYLDMGVKCNNKQCMIKRAILYFKNDDIEDGRKMCNLIEKTFDDGNGILLESQSSCIDGDIIEATRLFKMAIEKRNINAMFKYAQFCVDNRDFDSAYRSYCIAFMHGYNPLSQLLNDIDENFNNCKKNNLIQFIVDTMFDNHYILYGNLNDNVKCIVNKILPIKHKELVVRKLKNELTNTHDEDKLKELKFSINKSNLNIFETHLELLMADIDGCKKTLQSSESLLALYNNVNTINMNVIKDKKISNLEDDIKMYKDHIINLQNDYNMLKNAINKLKVSLETNGKLIATDKDIIDKCVKDLLPK